MTLSIDYLAGVIDGEGSIILARVHSKDKWRTPVVTVSSTTVELVQAIVTAYGGYICKHKTYKSTHLTAYSWRIAGRKAVALCAALTDKLIVPEKQRRARLIADNYLKCTPRNGKYTAQQCLQKQQLETEFFRNSSKPAARVELATP